MSITPITAPITAYSTPPTTSDPTNFDARADVLFGTELPRGVSELNVFVTAINVMIGETNTAVSDVTTKQGIASTAAANAAISEANALADRLLAQTAANTAVNAPGSAGTSTTSTALTVGLKSLVTQTGKNWQVGQVANLARTSAPTTSKAVTTIAAYNSGTGAIDLNIAAASDITGSGTFTDWTISLGGATGPAGAAGAAGSVVMGRKSITTTDTLGGVGSSGGYTNDLGKVITCTGTAAYTVTIDTAANCGANWFAEIFNDGSAIVTLAAASIDGATSKLLYPGDGLVLQGSGTDFVSRRIRGVASLGETSTAAVVQTTASTGNCDAVALSSTLAVVFHIGASNFPRLTAVSFSAGAATVGTPVTVEAVASSGQAGQNKVVRLSGTTGAVVYGTGSNTMVAAFSVSGTTITVGTPISIRGAAAGSAYAACTLTATSFLATWTDSTPQGNTCLITVSGTTCTNANTGGNVYAGGGTPEQMKMCAISPTQAVVVYSGNGVRNVFVVTESAGALSFSARVVLGALNVSGGDVVPLTATSALTLLCNGNNFPNFLCTIDCSGANPVWGAPVEHMMLSGAMEGMRLSPLSATTALMIQDVYSTRGSSYTAKMLSLYPIQVRGGDQVAVQPPKAVTRNTTGNYGVCSVAILDANYAVVAYSDAGNSGYPTIRAVGLGTVI